MLAMEGEKDVIDSLCHLLGKECPAAHWADLSGDILHNYLDRTSRPSEHSGNRVTLRMSWASVEAVS